MKIIPTEGRDIFVLSQYSLELKRFLRRIEFKVIFKKLFFPL
jgi:hypothetical protein